MAVAWTLGLAGCGDITGIGPQSGDGDTDTSGSAPASASSGSGSADTLDTDGASGDATATDDGETGSSTTEAGGLPAPYPIVLAHGFFGFDDFAGAGFVDYFWGVRAHLEDLGERWVFTPAVDPFNDSITRGEQLLAHVEAVVAETGHAKVNLVGHSQGGLDARYVAHQRPDLVASVTTISTPHHGTPIADMALGIVSDPSAQLVADWLAQTLGGPLWPAVDQNTSITASMQQLSSPGTEQFNADHPDRPEVAYFSIAGRSGGNDGGIPCEGAEDPPAFVTAWQDQTDPIDPLLAVTQEVLSGGLFSSVPNDGLVVVSHAKWGRFLGCIPADHLDQIGHLFGDGAGWGNPWDHRAFYAELVTFLRDAGL
jgi:triacylglycerol lipase